MPEASSAGAGFEGISAAVTSLQSAVSNGGFSISEEGGQKLLTAISTLQTKVENHQSNAQYLATRLPLGSSPAAKVYVPFLSTVASDPVQGIIPVLTKLRRDLQAAHDAITQSIANSQNTDQGNSDQLRTSGTIPV
jgi:hypothetical protein